MRSAFVIAIFLITCLAGAGCTSNSIPAKSTYSVDSDGVLTLSCAPETTSEVVFFSNETYTKSRVVFTTKSGNVTTYLAAPKAPKAAFVYAPGAGEKLAGHEERMVRFASAGYAFLFVDTRGNGGETAGLHFSQQLIQQDFAKFGKGEMPQYYLSICDLVSARKLLAGKYNVPVYAIGSSNGGRYAAVAAGIDPEFAGYIGISTSDWGLLDSLREQGVTGDPIRFAASIEPGTYIGKITPRPVWMYHNATDPIIPFSSGRQLYGKAGDPKNFTEFSGEHGINPEVDARIIAQWA
ncbi:MULTISPECIES: S9 family peptidase [unclassified Methanoregula]|uniref:alpha/beta hydrolase family protein n=1 Tax=unclassified Methanoregula TaxID=2649730 RepID=UPI0009CE84EC|nr:MULTISPECIES: alpha/beta hydrolase [unclassified Methanoregula]OPX61685.1 MAG: Alpha/beta hydrolase family protein [Methanoregula sp. PtaB.Bin085]OPY34006.1 MAG: Alpha/beta hydrolase family protein [Methanoregula sp. PtaU1.Bin006]